MKTLAKAALAATVLLVLAIPALAAPKKVSVKVINASSWDVHHMFLSPASEEHWGPDQLGNNIIATGGGSFTLNGIPCDTYDIKVVDEDGDECVIAEVDLCNQNAYWKITDDDLLECEGYGSDE